ncbi:putative MFS family arabinose efflux permease [Altererythrobacter atlanticus]|uniref:Hexuronate transporter n=1 Tax=Croceibacterium atlanticum TaxID=1267766 RepID=A0A0F7KTK9_9SPHN|nr:MFS transporter [Croceibacterium atlanticum]AKH42582.1 Hexuronate transporter [Croceibacterium atlanticum]MBB5731359.1 putative MFS family arabinose efflux permease [Croceibacterium atlanticum]
MQPSGTARQGNWTKNSPAYQFLLVFLLSLNFGIVFFDRQAINALMPFVEPELQLSGTQIGLLASGLSFTWAIAAFFVGKLSDSLGKRKLLLILSTIAFSLCSFLSGLATSFLFLFAARLLMGAAEGGVMPISHAMVASEVDPRRRGLAQGVAQNLGSNLLGSFLAPVVLVWFAMQFSWREAFYLAAAPGLLSAALIWFMLKEPEPAPVQEEHAGDSMSILQALKVRNMWICVVVGVLMVGHFVITWAFMPIYLVQGKGLDPSTMSWVMGALGIAAAIYSIVVSGLSDMIGRKPVMVLLPLLAVAGPLGALYYEGSAFSLAAIFFVGWAVNGIFPIFMATIPSETFAQRHHATVLGLAMGSCEVLGGVFGPTIAGMLNDAFDLSAFLWLLMGLSLVSGIVALGLKETAPAVLARRAR